VVKLTKRLDALRHQKDEAERQLAVDMAEAEASKAALTKERDELRRIVEEKEKAHLEFKKQVNELEKQCKAAQRKKSAKERLLQQKKAEKQKMVDDITRWRNESAEMRRDTEAILKEKEQLDNTHSEKVAKTRTINDAIHAENKVLEEEVRQWGFRIKYLEEERKKQHSEQNEDEREAERHAKEDEQAHETRMQDYQAQYAALWKLNQQVRGLLLCLKSLANSRRPKQIYSKCRTAFTIYSKFVRKTLAGLLQSQVWILLSRYHPLPTGGCGQATHGQAHHLILPRGIKVLPLASVTCRLPLLPLLRFLVPVVRWLHPPTLLGQPVRWG
jgi:hypothetical protein